MAKFHFFVYAAFILFTTFCVIVAVSNGDPIIFSLDPIPFAVEMPAYGLVFLGILIGLGCGWVVSFISGVRHARRHRTAENKIKELEKKLNSHESANNNLSNSDNSGKSPSD